MSNFNQIGRVILRYPAVTILTIVIFLGSFIFQKQLAPIFTSTISLQLFFSLLSSSNLAIIILLILFLIVLGPSLEKIYGSIKITCFFIFTGFLGGTFIYFFTDYVDISLGLISMSGFLGIYFLLILKRHYMLTKANHVFFFLLSVLLILLIIGSTELHRLEIYIGLIVGFILATFVKPQTFRQLVEMRWPKSMLHTMIVLVVTLFVCYTPKLIDWPNVVEGMPGTVDEWISTLDIDSIRSDSKSEVAVNYVESSQKDGTIENQLVANEPIDKKGDRLYNTILKAIRNMKKNVNLFIYTTNSDKVFDTLQQVLDEHPEIYYFDHSNSRFWSDGVLELGYKYSKAEVEIINAKLNELVSGLVEKELLTTQTEFDKVKVLHDYLVRNTAYDYDNYLLDTVPVESHSIVGTLLLQTAVCEGYAKSMQYFLNQIGIESIYVTGKGNSGPHAWNKVKIDGDWYNLDVTWDDPVPDREGMVSYPYFLVTDQYLAKDHHWEQGDLPVSNDAKYMNLLGN